MKSVSWIDGLEGHGWHDAEVIVVRHLYLGRPGVAAVHDQCLPHPNSGEKDLGTELSNGNMTAVNALITIEADLHE